MAASLYLIAPRSDCLTYYTLEVVGARGFVPLQAIADLSIPTVAALAPADLPVRLCDEQVSLADLETGAEYVGITCKANQWGRAKALANEFRRRGKVVIIGGPFATLSPEQVRPHCDILVRGELEPIAEEFFASLQSRRWKEEYIGGKADLEASPIPRWDLYPVDRTVVGSVQTSRGCPFNCEFCEVPGYAGRSQRQKTVAQVLAELDELYRLGCREVFLCDDNLTACRGRAVELVEAIRDWNSRRSDGPIAFSVQLSIDLAEDEELLQACAEAAFTSAFVGLETPNEAALLETGKKHILRTPQSEQIQRFYDVGIELTSGVIVGFDEDGPDVFDRHYAFWMDASVPVLLIGALVARPGTRLHRRMAAEGRLCERTYEAGVPWSTNFVPKRMSSEALRDGVTRLCERIYSPESYGDRVVGLLERLGRRRKLEYRRLATVKRVHAGPRPIVRQSLLSLLSDFPRWGQDEARLMERLLDEGRGLPEGAGKGIVLRYLIAYAQIRHMLRVERSSVA